jgi:hypothetical protein
MLDVLVLVAVAQGEYAHAITLAQEALAPIPRTGDIRYLAGMRANLAMAHLALGQFREAAHFARLGLVQGQELALRRNIAIQLDILAAVAAWRGQMVTAAQLFGAAHAARASEELAGWHAADRALYGPYLAAARTAPGESAFAAAWVEGERRPAAEIHALTAALVAQESADQSANGATAPHTR